MALPHCTASTRALSARPCLAAQATMKALIFDCDGSNTHFSVSACLLAWKAQYSLIIVSCLESIRIVPTQ
jgi:hypothetical protein